MVVRYAWLHLDEFQVNSSAYVQLCQTVACGLNFCMPPQTPISCIEPFLLLVSIVLSGHSFSRWVSYSGFAGMDPKMHVLDDCC